MRIHDRLALVGRLLSVSAGVLLVAACGDLGPAANADDAPAKRVTRANLDRIRLGMPEKEVRDLLGKPVSETKAAGILIVLWQDDGAIIAVNFRDGKVAGKRGDALKPSLVPKLTKANFDKIKEGMPEKELLDLLGPPNCAEVNDGVVQLRWCDSTDDPKYIDIFLEQGKVTVKSGEKLD